MLLKRALSSISEDNKKDVRHYTDSQEYLTKCANDSGGNVVHHLCSLSKLYRNVPYSEIELAVVFEIQRL